ncbi:MAG: tetratricopeptide repeat protein, partial [Candidatus Cloacimonadota bacterium]
AGAYLKSGESNLYWEYYYSALSDFEIARKLGADTMLIYDMLTLGRKGNEAKKFYDTSTDYYNRSEYEKAIEYALKSLELYRQIGGKQGVLSALQRLGWCHAGLFKHKEALA